jgi:hypothetical protein
MQLKKVNFKMILNISAWLFLALAGVLLIGIFGPIDFDVFSGVLFLTFLIMSIASFSVQSYIKEYPENQNKYFIQWLILFLFLTIVSLSVFVFA